MHWAIEDNIEIRYLCPPKVGPTRKERQVEGPLDDRSTLQWTGRIGERARVLEARFDDAASKLFPTGLLLNFISTHDAPHTALHCFHLSIVL